MTSVQLISCLSACFLHFAFAFRPMISSSLRLQPLQAMIPSNRLARTERPYIEDVLDAYRDLKNLTVLALGSSSWNPPEKAISKVEKELFNREIHRYGEILGFPPLQTELRQLVRQQGIEMDKMDLTITAGANQAFSNVASLLTDAQDDVIVVAPYYFSHVMALQLCDTQVHVCPFDSKTLQPDWPSLKTMIEAYKPKMVVITSPNNPSGHVWSREDLEEVVDLCKQQSTWLIVDQTYHEFVYGETKHVYPCGSRFDYERIIHLFSLSKSFGMAGWRLGYAVYPSSLTEHMRKVQDSSITHATIFSQKLALACLQETYLFDETRNELKNLWLDEHRKQLEAVRDALWPVVEPLGTVKPTGAFYFLVPVPIGITEEEAVDILARKYGVLLMHGKPFGCEGYLRLSYGSIPPDQVLTAIDSLHSGFSFLRRLSEERSQGQVNDNDNI